jgi:hypothetical protein
MQQVQIIGNNTNSSLHTKEIYSRLNSGNACYHSVHSLSSSCPLSRNVKVKIYRTIILPVVLYVCETWSPTLREEDGLRVTEGFENILTYKKGGKRKEGKGCTTG